MNRRKRRRGLGRTLLAAVAISVALGADAAQSYEPVGTDLRFSTVDTDGVAARDGQEPAIAYNGTANEYLVVWAADGLATDDEFELFGQRISAAGAELGGDFPISNVAPAGAARDAASPAVAFNPDNNQYLVVWQADGDAVTDNKIEIYGQLLNASGGEVGGDFPISSTGLSTDTTQGAGDPAVTYNPNDDEYVVVWEAGNITGASTIEVYGQRLSPAGGELPSSTDTQISDGADMGTGRQAGAASIAYGSGPDQYLVIWHGDGLTVDNDYEIFGQRLSDSLGEEGTDFRISTTGIENQVFRAAGRPSVAYGSGPNEYLATWHADALTADDETEIFGQRLSTTGGELGVNDFRISTTGVDGTAARNGYVPAAAYSPTGNEYLVVWSGDGLATDEEYEVFGQRLSAAGAEIGTGDFRISNAGADGVAARGVDHPTVAFGSTPNEYLVGWDADALATDNEFEVFGRRLALPTPATPPDPATPPATKCKKPKKKKKKRAAPSKKKKKKGCKKKKKKRKK